MARKVATALGRDNGQQIPGSLARLPFRKPYMAVGARYHEGDNNLVSTLWEITLLGAPALIYVRSDASSACPLPLTSPPTGRSGDRIVETLLRRIEFKGGRLSTPDVLELAYLLDTGFRRSDGLPGWSHMATHALPPEAPRVGIGSRQRPRGAPPKLMQRLAVAVEHDLFDVELREVSARLGFHDVEHDGRPRGAERARRAGRELLAAVGAWPWTHAPAGDLANGWRDSPELRRPLLDWHMCSCEELEHEAAAARGGLATLHRDSWSLTSS